MNTPPRIFISACEPSGDIHGHDLAVALRARWPAICLDGVGGPRMRSIMQPSFAMEELAVMGFADVFRALPRLARAFFRVRRHLMQTRPDLIITIDYSGGHLRLMRQLKKKGLCSKWLHYIAPGTWLGSKKRGRILETFADHLAVIYPHELQKWRSSSLPCSFVGNPVQLAIGAFVKNAPIRAFVANGPCIGLFPGSRIAEIERNLPLLLRVGRQLIARLGGHLRVSCCQTSGPNAPIAKCIAKMVGDLASIAPPNETHQLMLCSHVALAVSGTVCLELALTQTPHVAIYQIGPVDNLIARYGLRLHRKLQFFSLPNLLLGDGIFPEHFGRCLDEGAILESALQLSRDSVARARCCAAGAKLDEMLTGKSLVRSAADIVQELLS